MSTSVDYIQCKNCSKDSGINEDIDNINYCYNCKHLFQKKTVFGVTRAFDEGRRSSWNAGDKREVCFKRLSSSRRSSRGSFSGSADLPSIAEPDEVSGCSKEKEFQLSVEKELNKLARLTTRTNDENDFYQKQLFRQRFVKTRSKSVDSNNDFMKPLHCVPRGQTLQEFRCQGAVSVHTVSAEVYYPF